MFWFEKWTLLPHLFAAPTTPTDSCHTRLHSFFWNYTHALLQLLKNLSTQPHTVWRSIQCVCSQDKRKKGFCNNVLTSIVLMWLLYKANWAVIMSHGHVKACQVTWGDHTVAQLESNSPSVRQWDRQGDTEEGIKRIALLLAMWAGERRPVGSKSQVLIQNRYRKSFRPYWENKKAELTCTEPERVLVQMTQQREAETAPLCSGHLLQ